MVTLCIELIRQFYDLPRQFRLLGPMGAEEFVSYDNSGLRGQPQTDDCGTTLGYRVPAFDLEIAAQNESPYKTMEYNQLALQFFQLGFFNPDRADQALGALDMMEFKNKDHLMAAIARNGTLRQENERLKGQLYEIALVVDKLRGTHLAVSLSGATENAPAQLMANGVKQKSLAGKTAAQRHMDKARSASREAGQPR